MKNILIALMLCMVSIMGFGQKEFSSETFVTETIDEFGDKTGNMKVGVMATGYFSNSATSNSCAELIISIMKDKSWYSLYEYCGNHSSDESFSVIFTGTATHETLKINYDIPYEFIELCKNNDTIYVKMNETGRYATTTAIFKLFGCKNLYKLYLETFGTPNMITFIENGDFLKIYKNAIPQGELDMDMPKITCNKPYDYLGKHYDNGVRLDGKFTNGSYISVFGTNITVDGNKAKSERSNLEYKWFLKNVHVGSVIRIEYEYDSNIFEIITITEEQYKTIIDFFNK